MKTAKNPTTENIMPVYGQMKTTGLDLSPKTKHLNQQVFEEAVGKDGILLQVIEDEDRLPNTEFSCEIWD